MFEEAIDLFEPIVLYPLAGFGFLVGCWIVSELMQLGAHIPVKV